MSHALEEATSWDLETQVQVLFCLVKVDEILLWSQAAAGAQQTETEESGRLRAAEVSDQSGEFCLKRLG